MCAGGPVLGPTLPLGAAQLRACHASQREGIWRTISQRLGPPANQSDRLMLIGQLMYHSKRYDQAEEYRQEATAVYQLNHEAWYWLGEAFSSQGHKELAANCYRTALDLELTAPLQPFSVVLSSLVPSSL